MSVTIGNKKYQGSAKPINEYGVQGMQWGVKKVGSPGGRQVLATQVRKVRTSRNPDIQSGKRELSRQALNRGKERLVLAGQIRTMRKAGIVGSGAIGLRKLGQSLSGQHVPINIARAVKNIVPRRVR